MKKLLSSILLLIFLFLNNLIFVFAEQNVNNPETALNKLTARIKGDITDKGNGFYDAKIEVFSQDLYNMQKNDKGMLETKKGWKEKEIASTFFPDNWSQDKIQDEIAWAYGNKILKDKDQGIWQGISKGGYTIRIIIKNDAIESAYPYFLTK